MKNTVKRVLASFLSVAIITLCSGVKAYDIVNLPSTLTLSEALGVYDASDIKGANFKNISNCDSIKLPKNIYEPVFEASKDMELVRTITPHPFTGYALELLLDDNQRVIFFYNAGVEIGKYGDSNFVCYAPQSLNEELVSLIECYSVSQADEDDVFPINKENDFLKLPDDEWAKTAILESAANSLLPYRLTNRYGQNITREEFCVLVGNLIAKANNYLDIESYAKDDENIYTKKSFLDCDGVDSSVEILQRMGIINGKSDEYFEPNSPLTREEAATILCKTATLLSNNNGQICYVDPNAALPFYDVNNISSWAEYYVKWAYQKWIMNGDDNNYFVPKGYYTVDQAIITINRIYKITKGIE